MLPDLSGDFWLLWGTWGVSAPVYGIWPYDRGLGGIKEPPLPVISVGNLSLGGTNKTPFVAMVARKLLDMGLSPGIVSRGYGGAVRDTQVLRDCQGERDLVGDEPLLLSSSLRGVPVALSPNRYEGVEALVKEGCSPGGGG